MAIKLNPIPLQAMASLPYVVQEWLRQLSTVISTPSGSIPWASIDFTGSNINDILTKPHNSLQSIQGGSAGNRFHLTRAIQVSKTVAFGSLGSVTIGTTTVTATGATIGDAVIVTPQTQIEIGISIYGYVSASNTVTIVATNATAGSITMASRTYNVLVLAP